MSNLHVGSLPEGYRVGSAVKQQMVVSKDGAPTGLVVFFELEPAQEELEVVIVLPVRAHGADYCNERIDTLMEHGVTRDLANLLAAQCPQAVKIQKKGGAS